MYYNKHRLSFAERKSLCRLKRKKKMPKEEIKCFESLDRFRFITEVAGEPDSYGGFYGTGYYVISQKYKEWKVEHRDYWFETRLPVLIALLSLIVSIIALLKP